MTHNITELSHRGRSYVILKRSPNFNNRLDLFIDGNRNGSYASLEHLHQDYPHLRNAEEVSA